MVIPAPSAVLLLIQANFLGQSLISQNHLETRYVLPSAPVSRVELMIHTVDFLLPQQEHSQPRTISAITRFLPLTVTRGILKSSKIRNAA
jgi:hypothetical protein